MTSDTSQQLAALHASLDLSSAIEGICAPASADATRILVLANLP